jgi:hypothetical protein
MAAVVGEMIFQRAEVNTPIMQISGIGTFRLYIKGGIVNDEVDGKDVDVFTGRAQLQAGANYFTDTSLEAASFTDPIGDAGTLHFRRGQFGNPMDGYRLANLQITIDDNQNTVQAKVTDLQGRVLFELPSPVQAGGINVSQRFKLHSTQPGNPL